MWTVMLEIKDEKRWWRYQGHKKMGAKSGEGRGYDEDRGMRTVPEIQEYNNRIDKE